MKKLCTLPLILISWFCLAQGSWKTIEVPEGIRYDDIYFINDQIGWAVGNIRGYPNPLHRIYKTTNGGSNWNPIGPSNFPVYLRSIEFFDSNIGLCGSFASAVDKRTLYRTTNGGTTWEDISENISPRPSGVCGLAKADENTMYGVGVYWDEHDPDPAYLIKTIDKGLHWTYIDMSAYASTLIDAYFFDANHGFVTGSKSEVDGGIILYTADGGQTWEEKFVTNGATERIWKIQTPDNIHFYGSIEKLLEEGPTRIIRSSDAGQTWEIVEVWPDYNLCQMVGFIDSQHGWTGGYGQLFETLDGGSTWKKLEVGARHNRFIKISNDIAFMTGRKIYKFDRNGVITGLPEPETSDPVHKIKIFPNPTDGKVTISITFTTRTMGQVYLYNTAGKTLQKIFAGHTEAGEKIFTIDLSDQPSGTFMVTADTNEGMDSAKFIKK